MVGSPQKDVPTHPAPSVFEMGVARVKPKGKPNVVSTFGTDIFALDSYAIALLSIVIMFLQTGFARGRTKQLFLKPWRPNKKCTAADLLALLATRWFADVTNVANSRHQHAMCKMYETSDVITCA